LVTPKLRQLNACASEPRNASGCNQLGQYCAWRGACANGVGKPCCTGAVDSVILKLSSSLQVHVDVHGCVRARHSTSLCSIKQAQFSQDHNVIVHTLDVTVNNTRQLSNRHLTLTLSSANDVPTLLRQLAKELSGRFKGWRPSSFWLTTRTGPCCHLGLRPTISWR